MTRISVILLLLMLIQPVSSAEVGISEIEYSSTRQVTKGSKMAELWGLRESDIEKYEVLMSGPRGTFSPGIAPPLALALEESNETEKRRYLTIYAKLNIDRVEKELSTSRMYDQIFKELHPEPPISDEILFGNNPKKQNYIQSKDRFVIFVDRNCKKCKSKIANDLIRTSLFPRNVTDIYVEGLVSDNDLQMWASHNNIKIDDVQSGKVTINFMQENTKHFLKNRDYAIFVLRNDSLHNFSN